MDSGRQRGVLSLGLYVVIALGVALALTGGLASCEHNAKLAAQENEARVKGEYAAFRESVAIQGREAEENVNAIEAKWQDIWNKTKRDYEADLANRDAAIRKLRERPAVRPDSSKVPIVACRPAEPDAPSGEFIPLAEYRELEARAYDDALRLTQLQRWVLDTGHPMK